jgi:hypothetical protein
VLDGAGIICITGMHCSGTSATARIVNLLGVDFGSPDVGTQTYRTNTKGLWEHRGLRKVAQDVLKTLGGSWDDPPTLEPGWHMARTLDVHRAAAIKVVEREFGQSPLWGWKDPRSALLMPFWGSILGPLRVVICIRSPNDVASSLAKWDGIDRDRAMALWTRYTSDAEILIGPWPTIVSSYEDLVKGGNAFARLADFIGRPDAAESPAFQAAAARWIDEAMWNNRAGADPGRAVEGLPADVRAKYQRLLARSM